MDRDFQRGSCHAGRSQTDFGEDNLFERGVENEDEEESGARGEYWEGKEDGNFEDSEEEWDEEEEEEPLLTKEDKQTFQPKLTDKLFELHWNAAASMASLRLILAKCTFDEAVFALALPKDRSEMVERWAKPAGKHQRYQANQDREQDLEESVGRVAAVVKMKILNDNKRTVLQDMLVSKHQEVDRVFLNEGSWDGNVLRQGTNWDEVLADMEALTTKQKATRGSRMRNEHEQPAVRKGRSHTKPNQGAQKGAMSLMEECAAAMAKEKAASVELCKRFASMVRKPNELKRPVVQKDQVAGVLARNFEGNRIPPGQQQAERPPSGAIRHGSGEACKTAANDRGDSVGRVGDDGRGGAGD
eukprot:750529-Rhodomonas_salina.1